MADSRVILVGESNPYGADPEFALYCYPIGCAGHRMQHILGLPEERYLNLHRKNLCDDGWSRAATEVRAMELLDPYAPWRVVVLLGRKVTKVFEHIALSGEALTAFSSRNCCPGMTLVSLPHPSGRNTRLWNRQARGRAREILRELAPEEPWGSINGQEAGQA